MFRFDSFSSHCKLDLQLRRSFLFAESFCELCVVNVTPVMVRFHL
jgi:hypothetical protein